MARTLFLFGAILVGIGFISGCSDSTARDSIQAQEATIAAQQARIDKLESEIANLKGQVATKNDVKNDLDKFKIEMTRAINERMDKISDASTQYNTSMSKELESLKEASAQLSAADEEFRKKLLEGATYQQNIRTELDNYFKDKLERTMETMIDNKLKEVYPYLYYQKRY